MQGAPPWHEVYRGSGDFAIYCTFMGVNGGAGSSNCSVHFLNPPPLLSLATSLPRLALIPLLRAKATITHFDLDLSKSAEQSDDRGPW